jgi:hypothetical protein
MVIFAWSALVLVRRVVHGTSVVDGDRRYREYAHAEYWATKAYLFDPDEHCFFSR